MTNFKLSSTSKRRIVGVDPRINKIIAMALEISNVDFGIPEHGGIRTAEQQSELFARKLSKCDGWAKMSAHQSGKAFDVYAYVDGKASWDSHHLTQVAVAVLQASCMLNYKLEWGGLWTTFLDMPHFQLID